MGEFRNGAAGHGSRDEPPGTRTRTQKFKEDLGCAGLVAALLGAPAALAFMDWRPLLVLPALVVVQQAVRVLGPMLSGRRRLRQVSLVFAWSVGVVVSAAVAYFGLTLFSDIDPSCDPSSGSTCNLVRDGRVVGEADSSDAGGVRFQNVMIALSAVLLGGVPFCMLVWNGYRVLRQRR
ncbi:hypothetical protein [Streptomyces sp. SM11]|uniref:hypothetical protein n=1 Tax=Streptomyces sp. SM11 TaxID=565557 RepID=UPI0011AFFF95|nr:hypothetical protein [Streptomyces sp. SM11]